MIFRNLQTYPKKCFTPSLRGHALLHRIYHSERRSQLAQLPWCDTGSVGGVLSPPRSSPRCPLPPAPPPQEVKLLEYGHLCPLPSALCRNPLAPQARTSPPKLVRQPSRTEIVDGSCCVVRLQAPGPGTRTRAVASRPSPAGMIPPSSTMSPRTGPARR